MANYRQEVHECVRVIKRHLQPHKHPQYSDSFWLQQDEHFSWQMLGAHQYLSSEQGKQKAPHLLTKSCGYREEILARSDSPALLLRQSEQRKNSAAEHSRKLIDSIFLAGKNGFSPLLLFYYAVIQYKYSLQLDVLILLKQYLEI